MASEAPTARVRSPLVFNALDAGLMAGYAALAAMLTWWMGQDLNWDLLNYHFYNAYSLADGRIGRDVHAAGVQSFHNPMLDLPFYVAVRLGVPPPAFFLSLAAIQGLGLFFVDRLARLVVPSASPSVATVTGCLAAVTAAFGAGFLSEVGNTMHDDTLAVLVLGALWWMLASMTEAGPVPRSALVGAGLVAGAAAGLKLTVGFLCLGLCVAVLASPGRLRERVAGTTVFAAAAGVGALLTGGPWMWLMYDHFGSPLFPYLNAIFASPFAPLENFADRRFMPRDTSQAFFYPFYWVSAQGLVTEPLFRDGRIAAAQMCLAIVAVQAIFARAAGTGSDDGPQARRLVVIAIFWLVSYVVWLRMFSIYRYLIPLELLSGVIVVGTAARIAPSWARHLPVAIVVGLVLTLSIRVPDWGRTTWSDSYFGVETGPLEKYADATILMWDFPQGYLPPHFPRSTTFLRLLTNWGMTGQDQMWQRVVNSVSRTPDGQLFLLDLEPGSVHERQPETLARLGLERVPETCEHHASHSGGFRVCVVRRLQR